MIRDPPREDAAKVVRADGLFADDWFPIQVKQVDKVGRPDVDAFEAVMEREGDGGRQRGFFVAFGYTKDAEDECRAFFKRTGRIIKLLTVQEILDEEHVQNVIAARAAGRTRPKDQTERSHARPGNEQPVEGGRRAAIGGGGAPEEVRPE